MCELYIHNNDSNGKERLCLFAVSNICPVCSHAAAFRNIPRSSRLGMLGIRSVAASLVSSRHDIEYEESSMDSRCDRREEYVHGMER